MPLQNGKLDGTDDGEKDNDTAMLFGAELIRYRREHNRAICQDDYVDDGGDDKISVTMTMRAPILNKGDALDRL